MTVHVRHESNSSVDPRVLHRPGALGILPGLVTGSSILHPHHVATKGSATKGWFSLRPSSRSVSSTFVSCFMSKTPWLLVIDETAHITLQETSGYLRAGREDNGDTQELGNKDGWH